MNKLHKLNFILTRLRTMITFVVCIQFSGLQPFLWRYVLYSVTQSHAGTNGREQAVIGRPVCARSV